MQEATGILLAGMAFGKFGKYYPDGGSYRAERLDLVRSLTEAVAWFREQDGRDRDVRFSSDVDHYWIQTDATHLQYIIVNLLQNAAKYSGSGTEISVALTTRQEIPRFVVRDQGIGVPEPELAELFSPFFRASNVGERPGTGMGLPIVRKSAHLIGATVAVDSQLGTGTVFSVTLPGRLGRPPA